MVATATLLLMTSFHHQQRIWSIISGRHRIMMVRRIIHTPEAYGQWEQASKSLKGSYNGGFSASSDTLKLSENVLLVCFPNRSIVLWQMWMWRSYVSTITLQLLLLWAVWLIGTSLAATPLLICRCEDGMHWLDCCSRIFFAGGNFLALWRVDEWVIIRSFLDMFLFCFWEGVFF